jgi:hypothetical protein
VVLAHIAVAVARELDDPPLGDLAGRELLVVHGDRGRHVQRAPARVAQAPAEVDLVGVDEEGRVEPLDLAGGVGAHEQAGGLRPVDLARALAAALDGEALVQEERAHEGRGRRGEAPRAGLLGPIGAQQARAGRRGVVALLERVAQGHDGAGPQLGVLVEQQRVASAGPLEPRGVVLALARPALEGDDLRCHGVVARRGGRAVARGVVEDEDLGLEGQGLALGRDGVQAAHEQLALLGVDDAEGELDSHRCGYLARAGVRPAP